jgi:DNA-binding Lrp family transcriptional regulator
LASGRKANNGNDRTALDDLDLGIINALLSSPDASSSALAAKFKKPLSTIQRRLTRLERTILKKDYRINSNHAKWRSGEFFITVGKGRTQLVARQIFDKYPYLTMVTTTVNSVGNLVAHIYFRDSSEMFTILEDLKRIPDVTNVEYAEHIEKIGERKPTFMLEDLRK